MCDFALDTNESISLLLPQSAGSFSWYPHCLHIDDVAFLYVMPNQSTSTFLSYFWATFLLLFIKVSESQGKGKTCNQPAHQLGAKYWFSIPGRLHLKSWLHLMAIYSLHPESEFGRRSYLLIYKDNKSYKNRVRQNDNKKKRRGRRGQNNLQQYCPHPQKEEG